MSLFSALVKTVINVVTLPVDVAKDVITMGGVTTGQEKTYTAQKLDQIKKESENNPEK